MCYNGYPWVPNLNPDFSDKSLSIEIGHLHPWTFSGSVNGRRSTYYRYLLPFLALMLKWQACIIFVSCAFLSSGISYFRVCRGVVEKAGGALATNSVIPIQMSFWFKS